MNVVSLYDSLICRLCAEENSSGIILHGNDSENDLLYMINNYLPIKIEDDGVFPRTICPGCNIQVQATIQFFNLLIEGQKKLNQLWKEQKDIINRTKQQSLLMQRDGLLSNDNNPDRIGFSNDESQKSLLLSSLIDSDGELYSKDHHLSQEIAGEIKPRRKRGRPRKLKVKTQEEPNKEKNCETPAKEPVAAKEDIVNDPKLPISDGELDTEGNGRKRRKRKVPVRYKEAVQGKELERIFKEEGVLDEDDDSEHGLLNGNEISTSSKPDSEVIGHLEAEDGQNLGELIVINTYHSNKRRKWHMRKKKLKYHCEICGKGFLHQGRYLLHRSFHSGTKFECEECKQRFSNKDNFELHQKVTGHSGEGIINEQEDGAENKGEEVDPVTGKISCNICEKTFMSKQSYEIHLKAVHEGQKPFVCDHCGKGFGYQNSLKCHIMTHHENSSFKGFPCDICGKKLNHPSSVIYHKEAEHNNGRRFVCETCGKGFKHKQLLQRHQLVHSDVRPFQCDQCNASFKSKANLINHQSTHTGEKKHFCEICGQQFAHKTSLTLHYRWHSGQKPYQCNVCKKRFSQKGNLHEHVRIHTGEKPFVCDYCQRRFTTSSQYKLHVKRHTGERPWKCEFCGKAFLHKDTWKCHMRRHKGEKPFQCNFCNREFPEKWALNKHLRSHTGVKPYSCEICGKLFADCSNLTKHKKAHEREFKINIEVDEAEANEKLTIPLEESNTSSSNAVVNDMNVWNIIRQLNVNQSDENNEGSDLHQIIYITYQDPDDPNSKISEKYVVPEELIQGDDGTYSDLVTQLSGKLIQVTDEQGNPLRFTMQDGCELEITSGEDIDIASKETEESIPVELSTAAGTSTDTVITEADDTIDKQNMNNCFQLSTISADEIAEAANVKLEGIDGNLLTYEFTADDGRKVLLQQSIKWGSNT